MAVQDLNAIAFPTLSEAQIARLGRYAGVPPKTFRADDALFRCGDRDSNFFVIKSVRVLFTWLDLEGDPAVGQLLKQFGATEADTPIVERWTYEQVTVPIVADRDYTYVRATPPRTRQWLVPSVLRDPERKRPAAGPGHRAHSPHLRIVDDRAPRGWRRPRELCCL
ncbi:MAG: hypothetical protein ACREYC_00380 [Gammaproteobacteria bacterium]